MKASKYKPKEQPEVYRTDFPTRPIGGDNPYHCCVHCGVSVPEINGRITGHRVNCEWRRSVEF